MAILASDSGGSEYEQTPQGEHSAICYKIVDAGTQLTDFKGEISKKHKLYIFWELPECLLEDGRPMSEFKEYTLSLGERSNLRRDLQMWRNRPFSEKELAGFDLTAILGVSCKISVGLTSGGRSKVTGVFSADGGPKRCPQSTSRWCLTLRITSRSSLASRMNRAKRCVTSSRSCRNLFAGGSLGVMSLVRRRLSRALRCKQLWPRVATNLRLCREQTSRKLILRMIFRFRGKHEAIQRFEITQSAGADQIL